MYVRILSIGCFILCVAIVATWLFYVPYQKEQLSQTGSPSDSAVRKAPSSETILGMNPDKTAKSKLVTPDRSALVPHKSLYNIRMTSAKSGSSIVNISGQMFFEWYESCEGWITDHRFNLLYEYADSEAVRVNSDFATFEGFDGEAFNFVAKRKRNGDTYEEIKGTASIGPDHTGKASYTAPSTLEYDLDAPAYFPMGHTLGLLRQIEQGRAYENYNVFDGSDAEGPVQISAFVNKQPVQTPDFSNIKEVDVSLLQDPAYAVRMAFFPVMDDSAEAEYEMDFIFHTNGVISDMTVDYEDFTVKQELIALEPQDPEKACKR